MNILTHACVTLVCLRLFNTNGPQQERGTYENSRKAILLQLHSMVHSLLICTFAIKHRAALIISTYSL